MNNNSSLQAAKSEKYDEYYTQLDAVSREMYAYFDCDPNVFKGKTVLLPCDDPEWSAFTKFFVQKFDALGLHKLISTSYNKEGGPGKVFTIKRDLRRKKTKMDDLEVSTLEGDGDFRSAEVTKLRDEADIVVTNPPFSLFREYIAWLQDGDVLFSAIGPVSAISYRDVFQWIRQERMWIGYGFDKGNAYFKSPTAKEHKEYVPEKDMVKFRNVTWFTNIAHHKRLEAMDCMTMAENKKHNSKIRKLGTAYVKYDNYDAIEVPVTKAIPSDYDGVMGVPMTFLDHYCPEQFEILGLTDHRDETIAYLHRPGFKKYDRPYVAGTRKQARLLIKKRYAD